MNFMRSRYVVVSACAALVVAGAVFAYLALRDRPLPHIPNADAGIRFLASDDFNRLSERDRVRYAMAVVDLLRHMPYDDYLRLLTRSDDERTRMMNNLARTPGHEQVGSALFALFLDRFWDQDPAKRTATLIAIALIQQGDIGRHPERYGLPTHDQIRGEMTKFVSRQSVETQAKCAEFLVQLKRQREMLRLKDPF